MRLRARILLIGVVVTLMLAAISTSSQWLPFTREPITANRPLLPDDLAEAPTPPRKLTSPPSVTTLGPAAPASSPRQGATRNRADAEVRKEIARTTLRPTSILASQAELANPFRGSYQWLDRPPEPAGWPLVDSYIRIAWRDVEVARDVYDFSLIDTRLARARERGGKLGLRIMSACTGCSRPNISVPEYLKDLMPRGFSFTFEGTENYAPDWNDPDYLERLNVLLATLGDRYDNDPRLGWIEITGYGDWGEWHTTGWPYPSSGGATVITDDNARRIVDMNLAAFQHKRLVMLHDHEKALAYALSRSPTIGIRNDCLGDPWFTEAMTARSSIIRDRWKSAPIITEYCYQRPGTGGFGLAASQLKAFHVAMIANGNMEPMSSFSDEERVLFLRNNESSGYRIALNSLNVPSQIQPGSAFTVEASWSNTGVTPPYTPWTVAFRLRDPSTGAVAWQGTSRMELMTLLPTWDGQSNADHPVSVMDDFQLPITIPGGAYDVSIVVVEPTNYYRPLSLAVSGRDADGSYSLGRIMVGPSR